MTDIESAVISATTFAAEAYPDGRVKDPLLEEIELSDDGRLWLVTLSWVDPDRQNAFLVSLGPGAGKRTFKVFSVERETGEVLSMKIREFGVEHA